jgi:hypothetical protein
VHTGFFLGGGHVRERHHLEDRLGVNGRIMLKRIFKNWDGESWTEMIWLRRVVNAVTKTRVPQYAGKFMTSSVLVSFSGRTLPRGDMEIKIWKFSTS